MAKPHKPSKPTTEHNHASKIADMFRRGLLPQTHTYHQLSVAHDDWCDFLGKQGFCNCDPEVTLAWSYPLVDN